MRNTSDGGREYDERDRRNMKESMFWGGVIAAVAMLGLNMLNQIQFAS